MEYFPQKQMEQRYKQLWYTDKLVTTQIRSLKILGPLRTTLKSKKIIVDNLQTPQRLNSKKQKCPAGTRLSEGEN